jgi:NitT/TauT family transport system ATP-binding protein
VVEAGVVVEAVTKTYEDGTDALGPIDLAIRPGELVALVGPSGCGKTTLLRVIAGLTRPSSGAITVDPGNVGYVFQEPTLLPWRTVRRNVELPGELRGVSPAERRSAADRAIGQVGLAGTEGKYPRTLSGGMRMRVSMARALTMNPTVFLFDEPFGALDEITREHLNDELVGLFETQRFAGLFVTHSVAEAVFLGSRVLVMSNRPGRVVADCAVPFGHPRPPELRYEPAYARLCGEVSGALRGVGA